MRAESEGELVEAVAGADAAGEPLLVIAGGSNLVVADEGFSGSVAQVASRGVSAQPVRGRERLAIAAGEPLDALVARCIAQGLAGIECLSGIPGSVGAAPIQNVGAYGQEISETLVSVRAGFPLGYGRGRVGVSSKHTLALVNRGGATTAELIVLARELRAGVRAAFGITLEPEPTLVGVEL